MHTPAQWKSPRVASGAKPPLVKGARRSRGDLEGKEPGAQTFATQKFGAFFALRAKKAAEPADKPGSVVDSHSSRRTVTGTLEQPTRTRRGPRHEVPIWSCSRWGLPCRSVTGLAVRSYRTISPLPACLRRRRRYLSVALVRRLAPPRRYLAPCPMEPGLSSASRCTEMHCDDATVWPTPPRALSHVRGNIVPNASFGPISDHIRGPDSHPPYNALRGAPVISAASLAAVDGGRCAMSAA